jgi:prepilin-type N-terminal cleavage/methylation domain-containing protein
MRRPRRIPGYTLMEIIVALLIFTVGALSLAASSALVARAMARNTLRDRAARIAVSRIEVLRSQCALATTGREAVQQIASEWTVSRGESFISIIESVRCLSSPSSCRNSYRATVWCRP